MSFLPQSPHRVASRSTAARSPDIERARGATHRGRSACIDILVNNAGIAGPNAPVAEYLAEGLSQVMRQSRWPVRCCAVVPGLIAANYGRIVNIALCCHGKEGNPERGRPIRRRGRGCYRADQVARVELVGYDIAVTSITPAAARTAIFD